MHDSSLDELCAKPPATLAELQEIRGIGERKSELYGEQILEAVRRFDEAHGPPPRGNAANAAAETLRLLQRRPHLRRDREHEGTTAHDRHQRGRRASSKVAKFRSMTRGWTLAAAPKSKRLRQARHAMAETVERVAAREKSPSKTFALS